MGLGAIAMNKSVIGSDAMLAAGAMLTEGKVMEGRSLWAGRPAKPLKGLSDAAVAGMRMGTAHYAENAKALGGGQFDQIKGVRHVSSGLW